MHLVGGVAFYEADPGDKVESVLTLFSTWTSYDVSKVEILSPESPKYGFQDCPLAMVWHNDCIHLVVQRIIEESEKGEAKTFCQQYPPMPSLLPFHYELLCRQKLENSLCQLGYSRKVAETITARIPFEDLPKVTPEELSAWAKSEWDNHRRRQ